MNPSIKSARRLFGIISIASVVAIAALHFQGCASPGASTPQPLASLDKAINSQQGQDALAAADNVIGAVATTALTALVQKETGGGKVNVAQSAASALWSGVGTLVSGGEVQEVIQAFSGGALPQTAKYAAAITATPNGNPPSAVTNAIATVISTAAGAPPASPAATING